MRAKSIPSFCIHNGHQIIGFYGRYSFLSNSHPCQVTYEGMKFPNVECAFQAAKTTNKKKRVPFQTSTPDEAKTMGAELKLRADWALIEGKVMSSLTLSKYSENPDLKKKLLATKHSYLEARAASDDMEWGTNPSGKGNNKSGKIIMAARSVLAH